MKMTPDDLRPELRHPQVKGVATAFLDLIAWRGRLVAEMRESTGDQTLTILDLNILLHIFTFALDGGGSRAQEVIDHLGAPRRTVRSALDRWARLGFIVKDDGLYFPTAAAAGMFNLTFDARFRLIARICDTFADFQRAIGR